MSKYTPLQNHLISLKLDRWTASFKDIEDIIADSLPQSAHKYREWWANQKHGPRVQADAWLSVGWKTLEVNLTRREVVFVRSLYPK